MWHFKLTDLKLTTSSDIVCRSIYTSVSPRSVFGVLRKQTNKPEKARASLWGGAKEVLVKFPGRKKIREPEEIGTGNGGNRK